MDAEFVARRNAARARLHAMKSDLAPGADPDDPHGDRWFSLVYELAGDDAASVPWAALAPNDLLQEWLSRAGSLDGWRALDVGCGLGDNAEALAKTGARVTAFDYVDRAVVWARRRFPGSAVDYQTADLFAPPAQWRQAFDLVQECYTLQTFAAETLPHAARALAALVAPHGRLLVVSSAREADEPQNTPWRALSRAEIEALAVDGLRLETLEEFPPHGCLSRRWRALLSRGAER